MNEILVDDRERKISELEKEEEYRKYIQEHIANVMNSFMTLFMNNTELKILNPKNTEETIEYLEARGFLRNISNKIRKHDESKYSDKEFEAYRRKFFPTDYEKEDESNDPGISQMVKSDFEKAWHHHYTHNPHHVNFYKYCEITSKDEYNMPRSWIVHKEPLKQTDVMDIGSIIHMISDWEAMSKKFNTKTIEWYMKDADNEKNDMHPKTKQLVERMLEMVYNVKLN